MGKGYDSYDEMFTDPDVDIIYITTPHNTHYGFIRSILRKTTAGRYSAQAL